MLPATFRISSRLDTCIQCPRHSALRAHRLAKVLLSLSVSQCPRHSVLRAHTLAKVLLSLSQHSSIRTMVMRKRCIVARKRAAGVLKRPARMRLLAGDRANPTSQQLAGAQKVVKGIMQTHVVSNRGTTTPSGRALVYVAPLNVGASLCIGKTGKTATCAICKPSVRGAAQPGDVIVVISPALGTTRKRGIGDDLTQRVVLSVLLVDGRTSVPLYHSKATPSWADGHDDRIYSSAAVDSGGKTLRDANQRLADLFPSGSSVSPKAVTEIANTASWVVTYAKPRCQIRFALRSRTRHHNVTGPWAITLPERVADFTGSVLHGGTFGRFPSTGDDIVPFSDLNIPWPGRQLKYTSMRKGTLLRRWFDAAILRLKPQKRK